MVATLELHGLKMNKIQINRKKVALAIKNSFLNVVKFSKNNAELNSHRLKKAMVCLYLSSKGIDYYTEAVFKNNQRADIVIADWALCIEIIGSEKELKATKDYPFPVIPLSTNADILFIHDMIEDLNNCDGTNWEYYFNLFSQ